MIKIASVSYSFGDIKALDNINLTFNDGEIVGLLGLNGAGKSTLMRLIYGLLTPAEGSVQVDGIDVNTEPVKVRKKLGVLPDNAGLYKRLTARENIAYFGQLQGMSASALAQSTNELVEVLGMHDIAERRAEGFSLGERMKTALARAIVHRPQHILLDEPTNGLDVITTRALRRLLLAQKAAGRGVIFSSHLMYEVENLCDRIIVIAEGKVVAEGTVSEVVAAAAWESLEQAFVHLSGVERAHNVV